MRLPLGTRLIASFSAVILICGVISMAVGIRLVSRGIMDQARDKVRLDLNSAQVIYNQEVDAVRTAVRYTAIRFFLRNAMVAGTLDGIAAELDRIRRSDGLDVLTLTDAAGVVLMRAGNPQSNGDSIASNPVVRRALDDQTVASSTDAVPEDELLRDGVDLVARVHTPVAPTARAAAVDNSEKTDGLMMMTAAPVLLPDGDMLGVLYGARLLNGTHSLVDRIKETVYQDETYKGRSVGVATIFQGDLRICIDGLTRAGSRALGTRVPDEVRDRVLLHGETWIDRAYLVNDWYIMSYKPIRNHAGTIIGILSVGMLEEGFVAMTRRAVWTFLGITLFGMALCIVIGVGLAKRLMRPIDDLMDAAEALASGELDRRVIPDVSIREMEALGSAFNAMATSIKERDATLRQRARDEISKAERLALTGRLAAGVAHEINNPLSGILLFSRLLLKKAPVGSDERDRLERIAREAERCGDIVRGLLDFARQRQPHTETIDISGVAEQALTLLLPQALFQNVRVVRDYGMEVPPVNVDPGQMEQVFVNILINAAEAMASGGVLTVRTRLGDSDQVEVSFGDTGLGISEDAMGHLFEPFFTTKDVGHGTGLGLAISHGIVESHGGELIVTSATGQGTEVVVRLPSAGRKT